MATRDFYLGRIGFPTIYDDLSEQIGDQLEVVGASVTAGERRARSYTLTIPVHGAGNEADPYSRGMTLRRQVRALFDNPAARLQGLYLNFAPDSEQNAWMLIGGGDLQYSDGGLVNADFKLALSDAYRIANPRTHRPGRRFEVYDRRLSSTARDYLGSVYSTDFAAQTALALGILPVSVSDAIGTGVVTTYARIAREGPIAVLPAVTNGQAVTFEQPEGARHKSDVVIYDRRNSSQDGITPQYTNYVTNPSLENDLTGWSGAGSHYTNGTSTLTRVTSAATAGQACGQASIPGSVGNQGVFFDFGASRTFKRGVVYIFTVRARLTSGTSTALQACLGTAGDDAFADFGTVGTQWVIARGTWQPQGDRTSVQFAIRQQTASGVTLQWDAALVTVHAFDTVTGQTFYDGMNGAVAYSSFSGRNPAVQGPGTVANGVLTPSSPVPATLEAGPAVTVSGDWSLMVKFTTRALTNYDYIVGFNVGVDQNNYLNWFVRNDGSTWIGYVLGSSQTYLQNGVSMFTADGSAVFEGQDNTTYWARFDKSGATANQPGTILTASIYDVDPFANPTAQPKWTVAATLPLSIATNGNFSGAMSPKIFSTSGNGVVATYDDFRIRTCLPTQGYFDGDQPGYVWTGKPHASTSTGPWGKVNMVADPGVRQVIPYPPGTYTYSTSGGYGGNSTISRVIGGGPVGIGNYVRCITNGTTGSGFNAFTVNSSTVVTGGQFFVGQPYWVVFWARSPQGRPIQVTGLDEGGGNNAVAGVTFTLTQTWTRYAFVFAWPSPGNFPYGSVLSLGFQQPTSPADNGAPFEFHLAGLQIAPVDQLASDYFDGDQPRARYLAGSSGTTFSVSLQPDDPQDVYGWEEVLGPNQPLTSSDVPVIGNGICRLRYSSAEGTYPGFKLDAWQAGGGWVEQGKVLLVRGIPTFHYLDTLVSAQVIEWTPERAVILAVMASSGDATAREKVYLTLQRGWAGPRIEVYYAPRSDGSKAGGQLEFHGAIVDLNASALKIDASSVAGAQFSANPGPGNTPNAQLGASTFTGENWVALLREASTPWQVSMAALQVALQGWSSNGVLAYGGANRNEIQLYDPNANLGYLSAQLGLAPQATGQVTEAENATLGSGTTGGVSDGAASNGLTTTATRTSDGIHVSIAGPNLVGGAKYRVFVRVKTTASTLNVYAIGSTTGATKTTTSTSYVWLDLGDIVASPSGAAIDIHAWVSAAATLSVDRVESFLLEDRGASGGYAGARDLGQSALYDVRSVPTLIAR